jgi:hypothetical protein
VFNDQGANHRAVDGFAPDVDRKRQVTLMSGPRSGGDRAVH